MKRIIFIIVTAVLLSSCGASKHTTSIKEHKLDSIKIELSKRTVLKPDTVFIEIPAQKAERTTKDAISYLENDFAFSEARINPDGTLSHTLDTKPQTKPIATTKTIEYVDSIVYKDKVMTLTETVTKYVEKELSWWQQTQIYGFWACGSLFILNLIIVYRKKILKFVLGLLIKI